MGTSLPSQPLEQVRNQMSPYHSGDNLSAEVTAKVGEMPVPGPGVGNQAGLHVPQLHGL